MRKKERRILDIYEKWSKLRKVNGDFIPFCRQDNWAGHMVMDFVKYFYRTIEKEYMTLIREHERRLVRLEQKLK